MHVPLPAATAERDRMKWEEEDRKQQCIVGEGMKGWSMGWNEGNEEMKSEAAQTQVMKREKELVGLVAKWMSWKIILSELSKYWFSLVEMCQGSDLTEFKLKSKSVIPVSLNTIWSCTSYKLINGTVILLFCYFNCIMFIIVISAYYVLYIAILSIVFCLVYCPWKHIWQ